MDVNQIIQGFLGSTTGTSEAKRSGQQDSGKSAGLPDGLLGGAAAGGMVALLLGTKKGRKLGGKAIKYGGMAAVGGLAYKAYRDWQTQKTSGTEAHPLSLPRPPVDSGFDVEHDSDVEGEDFRLALLRAMISAAKADGHVDREEHLRLREQMEKLEIGTEEKAVLFDYFSASSDAAEVAGLARTEAQRAELYLASTLAVDPDTAEERQYLDALAGHLSLPEGLRGHLDLEAEAARREVSE